MTKTEKYFNCNGKLKQQHVVIILFFKSYMKAKLPTGLLISRYNLNSNAGGIAIAQTSENTYSMLLAVIAI